MADCATLVENSSVGLENSDKISMDKNNVADQDLDGGGMDDVNNESDSGEGEEEMEGEIVSDIEFILPKEVVESCVALRAGGESSFWSVNKEAMTSSQLTMRKLEDESVKIRVTVVALGDSTSSDPSKMENDKEEPVENGAASSNSETLQSEPSSKSPKKSPAKSIEDKSNDETESKAEISAAAVVREKTEKSALDSKSQDVNGNTDAVTGGEGDVGGEGGGDEEGDLSNVTTDSSSGTTVIIVKRVNKSNTTRDMNTQTDSDLVTARKSGVPSTVIQSSTLNEETPAHGEGESVVASNGSDSGNENAAAANSRDIAERLKAKEAIRKAAEIKKAAEVQRLAQQRAVAVNRVVPPKVAASSNACAAPSNAGAASLNAGAAPSNYSKINRTEVVSNKNSTDDDVVQSVEAEEKSEKIETDRLAVGLTGEVTKLSCDLCGEVSDGGYIALMRHVKKKHTDCTFVRTYIDELKVLQAEAHKCPVCRKGFATSGAMTGHIRACHGSIEWMRAVGGTGGSIAATKNIPAAIVTKAAVVKPVEAKISDKSDGKAVELQTGKKNAVVTKAKPVPGSAVKKADDKTVKGKEGDNKILKTPRGKRKISESATEEEHVESKKTRSTKKIDAAPKKDITNKAPVKPVTGGTKDPAGGGKAAVPASGAKAVEEEKGTGKKVVNRQPARRFVCDLCSQVFTTSTVLATHMRYCKKNKPV